MRRLPILSLSDVRHRLRLSQSEMTESLGLASVNTYRAYELGNRPLPVAVVVAVADLAQLGGRELAHLCRWAARVAVERRAGAGAGG